MRSGRSDAFDIFSKWQSEHTLLRVLLGFGTLTFRFVGRIIAIDDAVLKIVSDDANSEMAFKVLDIFFFDFSDYRDLPEGGEIYEYDLTVFLGPGENTDNFIAFSVLRDSSVSGRAG